MRGRDKFKKYKRIFLVIEKIYGIFPIGIRKKSLDRMRYSKGLIGIGLRYCILKAITTKIGDNVSVFQGCYLLKPEYLEIGDNVSIQPNCYIDAEGKVKIGNNVSIAHGVSILSSTHNYENPYLPIKEQGYTFKPVIIEDNVWIGAKVTILAGITVASGAVIGAGAVVTHDIGENEIVAGVPAKLIKKR